MQSEETLRIGEVGMIKHGLTVGLGLCRLLEVSPRGWIREVYVL